jgi:hypothetical protein
MACCNRRTPVMTQVTTLGRGSLGHIGTINSWDPYHLPNIVAEEVGLTARPSSG